MSSQSLIHVSCISAQSSFEKAKSWVKELQRQANPNIVIALVGNKIDLLTAGSSAAAGSSSADADEDEDDDNATTTGASTGEGKASSGAAAGGEGASRAVPKEEAEAYAKESNLLFFETSAKTGEGIVEVFTEIAKKIPINDILANQARQAAAGATGGAAGRTSANAGGRVGAVDLNANGERNRDGCNC